MAVPGLASRQLLLLLQPRPRRLLLLLSLSSRPPRRGLAASTPGRTGVVSRGAPWALHEARGRTGALGITGRVRGLGSHELGAEATGDARPQEASSVNAHELAKFQALAHSWWDERGELAALHRFNSLRVPFIRDGLLSAEAPTRAALPLKGFSIVDVGCGGGILCEPLARIGATVLGIDPVKENVYAARAHARSDPRLAPRLRYEMITVEELAQRQGPVFDAVVASEVVEHVNDPAAFIACCCDLIKPGGSLFLTTINKTPASFAVAIVMAEWLLGIIPRGTHSWEAFVEPSTVRTALEQSGLSVLAVRGICLNPLHRSLEWAESTDVNYAVHAIK